MKETKLKDKIVNIFSDPAINIALCLNMLIVIGGAAYTVGRYSELSRIQTDVILKQRSIISRQTDIVLLLEKKVCRLESDSENSTNCLTNDSENFEIDSDIQPQLLIE
ncbi:hypothetical protein L1267_16820 [Pseudoalteromonas sp. OFAV1]|uniref:hypothetical protein n=1 Tax=Pseudoalteromonas sp. OFAV1 TaxID=2908892 RepID=UPI001F2B01EB|nr:hypothetical protein [Pseudoalteromonas sp. OFAV1]MCF2902040.1 hypothetical protein [Pseudoalteromonas sp. OFAV1]